ncbi:unnamed protein product [Phyllotreta striolata]|uniref:TLC domain-containing protein n=1 Tax=Phyllotreta striolata TaxID=444603 RepID=A0A9N9TQF8_PHYSR|nr:unnamed protein product [Phyllotreta striolata]
MDSSSFLSHRIFYPIPFALCLLIIRHFLERYCFDPIGIALGINPPKVISRKDNPRLVGKIKQTDLLSPHQARSLNDYLIFFNNCLKYNSLEKHKISRFSKSCWHFSYYLVEFIHGVIILWGQPWFEDLKECWIGHPHHKITASLWIYYMINLTYYWSLLIHLFVNERRKDFLENAVHHTIAMLLIYISFVLKFHRIGTITIVVLFVSDIFLEMAKILKYLNKELPCTVCFGIFTIVWTVSRLIIYPSWVLKQTLIVGPSEYIKKVTLSMYLMNTLLCLVGLLSIFWTIQIYKVVWKVLNGQELQDERSDSESE